MPHDDSPTAAVPARWPFLDALLGTGVLAAGEFASRGLAFVAVAVLTRRLGPEGFGVVGFATAIAGYLSIAVHNGVGEVAARDLADRSGTAHAVYGRVFTIRVTLAAAAWAVMLAVAVLLPQPFETQLVVAATGLSFVAAAVDPGWAFKALGRPTEAVLLLLGAQGMYAAAAFLLVPDRAAVVRVPLVQFGAELLAATVGAAVLLNGRLPRLDWSGGRTLLGRARYLTASRVVRGLTINFDMVLLGLTAATAQLGMYAASYRVLFLLMAIGGAIGAAFLPVLARTASVSPEAFSRTCSAALAVALAVALPLALGGAVVAPDLLAVLFGTAYVPATTAFRLLLLAGGCFIVYSSLMYAFIIQERTRLLAGIHLAAAVLNVGMNLWGIPHYGIVAAGASTLAAEGLTAVATVVVLARGPGLSARLPVTIAAASLVMTVVVLAVDDTAPLAGRVAGGALVYVLALALLGGARLRLLLRNILPTT